MQCSATSPQSITEDSSYIGVQARRRTSGQKKAALHQHSAAEHCSFIMLFMASVYPCTLYITKHKSQNAQKIREVVGAVVGGVCQGRGEGGGVGGRGCQGEGVRGRGVSRICLPGYC